MSTRQPHTDTGQGDTGTDDGAAEPSTTTDSSAPAALSMDVTFGLLKNRRRRETLQYLREHDGEAKLDEVAEHIAAGENDTTVAGLSSDQRKRVYIGLYQCHLPKLDDAGVVDYDKDRGTIRMNDSADQLFQYLDPPEEKPGAARATAALASAAVGGIAVAALTAGVLDAGPFGTVPDAAWAVVGAAVLLAIAGANVWLAREHGA